MQLQGAQTEDAQLEKKKKTPWKKEREGGGTKDISLQSSHHLSSHSDAAVKVFIGDKV